MKTLPLLLLLPLILLPAQEQPLIFPVEVSDTTAADIPDQVIDKVDPSVVSIQHEKSGGTGFILTEDGYILSNGHVVRGDDPEQPMKPARNLTVILHDDRKFSARVLGFSMDPDVALLKINPEEPLQPVEMADSQNARVGQRVFAVGTPVGLKRTFTGGILSNTERTDLGTETVVFQTDAAINSGNSGGPLFDRNGRVLGINTYASRGRNNLGFTIPIHIALDMVDDLKTRGRFVRALVPLYFTSELYEELSRTLDIENGVLVSYVKKGSPAYKMGLRHGDVIVERNGEPVSARSKADLLKWEWENTTRSPGEEAVFTVIRGLPERRERLTFTGVVEELPPMPKFGRHAGELPEHLYEPLGLGLEQLTDLHHIIHELPPLVKGAYVKTVRDNSVASRAGLQEQDVVVRVGNQTIRSLTDFRIELDRALARTDDVIEIEVVRRKVRLITALAPDYLLKGKDLLLVANDLNAADIDLLHRELLARGASLRLATPGKTDIPRPDLGTPLLADLDLNTLRKPKADILLFAGGEGAVNLWKHENALALARKALDDEDIVLAAIGPAALLPVLAQEDELEPKITLPRELSGEAVRRGATYTGKDVESDQKLVTTTGREREVLREFLKALTLAALR